MNKSVSLLLLWHIWKWLRFIFMSLNPYVPYDAFNVSLVEKLSWICRKYRLYHEIHQDKTFETTPFWSHYCIGLDDLTLGRMIRTICRFVSGTCRMIWTWAGTCLWIDRSDRSGPEQCSGVVVMRKMPSKEYIEVSSHHCHKFGYIQHDIKKLKHNFNYCILFVCLTKFVSKLAMFLIEPSALQSRYSKS